MILLAADAWGALVDRGHARHAACVRALKDLEDTLATVWPVVSDVLSALAHVPKAQDVVWEMLSRGAIEILLLDETDVSKMRELMRRNVERGMSLADAAVMHVAQREQIRTVMTLGARRLGAYRAVGRRPRTIPGGT